MTCYKLKVFSLFYALDYSEVFLFRPLSVPLKSGLNRRIPFTLNKAFWGFNGLVLIVHWSKMSKY